MEATTSSSESRCKNPACGRLLPPRVSGGHRQREYCDDVCRQAARRVRLEGARRRQCIEQVSGWGAFQPATIDYLANWLSAGNEEGARRLARLIQCEQGQAQASLGEVEREERLAEQRQPRAALSVEQAHERARLHGYLDEGVYLESTQRLFVRVFQAGQIEPGEMREAIHQERGGAGQAKERVVALEQELADTSQGRDQVQERFREYVCMTNERVSELTGELATLRQERERSTKRLTKADMRELEQARGDLLRLYQESARSSEEIHRLSELAYELQMRLGAEQHRITELESNGVPPPGTMAAPDEASQKLLQNAARIQKLEKQGEMQRLESARSRARTREVATVTLATDEALLSIGRRLGYPRLDFTRYGDDVPVHIQAGELSWTNFSLRADCVEVKRALEVARKRDNQANRMEIHKQS